MYPLRQSLRSCAAIAILFVSTSALLTCQESKDRRPPGAVMLKRIAEAVDGDRSGRVVYVVASYEGSSPVLGVFSNPKEAEATAAKAGPQAAVFGPYQSVLDSTIAQTMTCVHIRTSVMNFRCVPPGRASRPEDIAGLTLMVLLADGSRDSIPLPQGADAIFVGSSAFDKFVVPYYVRVIGLGPTMDMQSELQRGGKP